MESSSERNERHGLDTDKERIAFEPSMGTALLLLSIFKFERCCV